jgi:hypothetical protein
LHVKASKAFTLETRIVLTNPLLGIGLHLDGFNFATTIIYFSFLPLPFSLFIDRIFAAGFKTAILQPLAGQSDQGDFFAVAQDGIDGVGVEFHGGAPSYFYPI